MKELISNPELCDGCMKCERNCPQNAIRVINEVPIFCMHCGRDKAPCLNICPNEAIDEIDGAIVINQDKCVGCSMCRDACPIGAITINERGVASKCDLCIDRDTPVCVSVCPKDALTTDSSEMVSSKQEKVASELGRLKGISFNY